MIEATAVTGMVIASSPINEYDRRVVLLTKERGKITAFARGARRQYSPMLASTQLFCLRYLPGDRGTKCLYADRGRDYQLF